MRSSFIAESQLSGGTQTQQVNLALIGSAPSNRVASYWDTAATGGATKTVSYDAAGNTTNDGTYSFTYDAENRIVQVNAVATGAVVATYTYDSANRRIKKTVGTTTTCSVWEGAQVVAEYNNAAVPSSPNTEYIFTGGRMLAEERTGSGTTRFFHQDRLSTRLTTNSAGAVLGTQSHLPFGEQLSESSEQQKWKFTTYERDSETGDDYAINRGYWPTLARFRQGDPLDPGMDILDPVASNRFAYVVGDPANLIDPLGLYSVGFLAILYGFGDYFTPAEFASSLYIGFGLSIGFGGGIATLYQTGVDDNSLDYPQYLTYYGELDIFGLVRESFQNAQKIIQANPNCRKLFGKTNLPKLFRRTNLSVGQTPAADVESGIRNGKPYVKVSASSNVFSPREDVVQAVTRNLNSFFGANLNISEWRSAVMIHELLHAAGFARGDRDTGVKNVKRLGGGTLVNSGSFGVTAAVLRYCFNIAGLDRFFKHVK